MNVLYVCMYFSVFSQQTCLLINNKYAGCRKTAQMPYGNSAGPKQSLYLGPVVQSIISLTSSLVVKVLTVLVSTIFNSQVFFAEKTWVAFANCIFSAKILAYMPMTSLVLNNWALQFQRASWSSCCVSESYLGQTLAHAYMEFLVQKWKVQLTLILLNNLISHTHIWISANQIISYNVFVQIHKLDDQQCRSWSDGFFRNHLIWSYTVCKSRGCREQQDKG